MTRRIDLAAGGALACLYLALMSGHLFSVDGLEMYRQGLALTHGSVHFLEPLHWGPLVTANSKFGIGLSLAYVPSLLVLNGSGSLHPSAAQGFDLMYRDALYAGAGAPLHALVTAAAAVFTARIARRLGGGNAAALWALVFFGLGSPALIYARGDWSQPLTALGWAIALDAALAAGMGSLVVLAAAIFGTSLTRVVDGAILAPFAFGIALWVRRRPLGPVAAAAIGFGLGIGANLLVAWLRYGSPFVTGYEGEGWTTPPWIGLPGALISPGRGILLEFPAAFLAVWGIVVLARSGRAAPAFLLGGLALAELVNTALWSTWWGGANWGLRLFVPALAPLAALAGVAAAELRGRAGWLNWAALAGGLLFAVPCVLIDLFSGLPAQTNESLANFHLHAYPPLGAWPGLRHVFGTSLDDHSSVDVLWLRLAGTRQSWLPLLPMALLLAGAAALAAAARRGARYNPAV